MIIETIVPAHAKGVGAVLAHAGLRSDAAVSRSSAGVNVLPKGVEPEREGPYIEALLEALTGAGYECHRCRPMPWLVIVTGKRKSSRVSS